MLKYIFLMMLVVLGGCTVKPPIPTIPPAPAIPYTLPQPNIPPPIIEPTQPIFKPTQVMTISNVSVRNITHNTAVIELSTSINANVYATMHYQYGVDLGTYMSDSRETFHHIYIYNLRALTTYKVDVMAYAESAANVTVEFTTIEYPSMYWTFGGYYPYSYYPYPPLVTPPTTGTVIWSGIIPVATQ
jgi:hypothetical protein